jgi:hypothetical protein
VVFSIPAREAETMTTPISPRKARPTLKAVPVEAPRRPWGWIAAGIAGAVVFLVVGTMVSALLISVIMPDMVPTDPETSVAVAPLPDETPSGPVLPSTPVTLPVPEAPVVATVPPAAEPEPAPPATAPMPMPAPVKPEEPVDAPAPKKPEPKEVVKKAPQPPEDPVADESKTHRIAFLGTMAEGRRFFFICDNSGSMNGVKMVMLKNELATTLKSLKPESRFFITFFNSEAHPLPAKDWQQGERDVPKALAWVAKMGVGGDTNPQSAFEQAFRAKPAPDVIFFMTDGQIPAHIPARVRKLNQQQKPKVVIHTLLLEARNPQALMAVGLNGADVLLKQIAADSGGTYRQVVVPLPGNPVMMRPPVRPPFVPVRRFP